MKLNMNLEMEVTVANAFATAEASRAALIRAMNDFNAMAQDLAVATGLGKGALVRHVHAKANHGNMSPKEVISEVTGIFGVASSRAVMLRIRLGSVSSNKRGFQWADLNIEDVLSIEDPSDKPFHY
jgi:hypothetical protein